MTRKGLPPQYIENIELSELTEWADASKALDIDDHIRHIIAIQLSRPVSGKNDFEAQRLLKEKQGKLDNLQLSRDIILGYAAADKKKVTVVEAAKSRESVVQGMGKITRLNKNGRNSKRDSRPIKARQ